jgi:hypothetical protein
LEQVVIALVSVVVGAVLTAVLQYSIWKRQHREEQKSSEEREIRRERRRAAERFREVAGLLIEINGGTVSGPMGPYIDHTQLTTTTLIENSRLRRELLNAAAAVRDLNILKGDRLNIFVRKTEKISQESASSLRSELDAIVAELRADVSISDK